MSVDPVCGMEVDEAKAVGKSTYQHQVFYFCSPHCKQKFDERPERYTED
jgi:YHS domain-containing protein